jgi:hypothetical protein
VFPSSSDRAIHAGSQAAIDIGAAAGGAGQVVVVVDQTAVVVVVQAAVVEGRQPAVAEAAVLREVDFEVAAAVAARHEATAVEGRAGEGPPAEAPAVLARVRQIFLPGFGSIRPRRNRPCGP